MSAPPEDGFRVYTFDTTNQAMWAEEVALERGIPAEVVPAPAEAKAKCNLALRTLAARAGALEEALEAEGVPFTPFPAG